MIIEVESITKTYKKNLNEIKALDNVSFFVNKNQILGILGPNGAGKTTLLKIITGIAKHDSGKIRIFSNENIYESKDRIGFLPENPEFLKNITAFELLEFSLNVADKKFDKERIDYVLNFVNLYKEKNERVKNFSKGMLQRIGIAQAIVHEPDILILDEPMSGLDPLGRRMVIEIIENYFKEGKTILFSTHNLDDIDALCTNLIIIKSGQMKLFTHINELRKNVIYTIEAENKGKKVIFKAKDKREFWDYMDEIRIKDMRIIRVNSGITRELEKYYEEENESKE